MTLDRITAFDAAQDPEPRRRDERPPARDAVADPGGLTPPRLVTALRADQRRRWTAGERVPAAEYFRDYPALGGEPELALELIYGEFLLREELGEAPTPEEYQQTYPAYAERLAIQIELHRALGAYTEPISGGDHAGLTAETIVLSTDVGLRGPRGAAAAPPTLKGYEILEELGRGGMGIVYKARDLQLGRVVALKMIRVGELDGAEAAIRFLREAELIARLRHPNIVQIYDIGEQDGRPYVELEYVEGGSLDRRLGGAPWPMREAAHLIEVLARATEEAHRQGIVHRDLKPANVLLDAAGQPKITDFGLAKRLMGGADQTTVGAIMGTPSYMAPEQAAGRSQEISPRVDVYALGAILYELLTGRPPFRAASTFETLIQVREHNPQQPRSVNPAVPRDLEIICATAMAKEPNRRYPSAHALAEDLARFLDGHPIQARPIRRAERFCRWCGRNPALAGLSAVAGLLLMTVVLLATGAVGPTPAAPGDGSLRRVQHAGQLVIATDPRYPPMEYWQDGQLVGFDVDLARHLARRLGVRAKFVPIKWGWEAAVNRLNSRDFDMLISTVFTTDDRDRQVDFVEYWRLSLVFVCRRGVTVRREPDLAGKVVAVQVDTIARDVVERLQREGVAIKEIVVFPGTTDPLEAVRDGRAEVALVHEPVGLYFTDQHNDSTVTGSVGHARDPQPIGIVFCEKDKDLQAAVAHEIKVMRQDGSFTKLLEAWFGR